MDKGKRGGDWLNSDGEPENKFTNFTDQHLGEEHWPALLQSIQVFLKILKLIYGAVLPFGEISELLSLVLSLEITLLFM